MTPADLEAARRRILEQDANLDLHNPVASDSIAALARQKVVVGPTLTVSCNMILLNDLPEAFERDDNGIVPQRLSEHWSD